MVNSHGRFVWYELMTTDVKLARAFYASVVGWGAGALRRPAPPIVCSPSEISLSPG